MKHRILSLLLAATLLAALAVPALAVEFTDLEGHWAEPYITELAELGYMTGYGDGTVGPDNDITGCHALVLLSRFYPVTEAIAEQIHDDYGDFVASNIDPTLSWAYDELELCLAAGILSQREMTSLRLNAPIQKELLSVLLVRALRLTDEAASLLDDGVELTFADADEIAAAYHGHIAVLAEIGIVGGDTRNEFTPHANVTRGVVAAMVVRALEYLEEQGGRLILTAYEKTTTYEGVIAAISGSLLTLQGTDGICRLYIIPANAIITDDDGKATLRSTYVGCYASVQMADDTVTRLDIETDPDVSALQGRLQSVASSNDLYVLTVEDLLQQKDVTAKAGEDANVFIDGSAAVVSALKTGAFVTVLLEDDVVTTVIAMEDSITVRGSLSTLAYGVPVILDMTLEDGCTARFLLDLTDLPTILRGGKEASIERLSVDDTLTMTVAAGQLLQISTPSYETTVQGTLTSITTTATETVWSVTGENKRVYSLTLGPSVQVIENDTSIAVSDIGVGDTVLVVADGSIIVTAERLDAADGATKISGTVLVADREARKLILLSEAGKLIYVTTGSISSVIDSATGKEVSADTVSVHDELSVYGSYGVYSGGVFRASSIIIED